VATLDIMQDLVPEAAGVADAVLTRFLGYAALRVDATAWGGYYEMGVVYLAGHMLAVSALGASAGSGSAAAGPVASDKAGDLARGYGALAGISGSDALFATTAYGREYLALRAQAVVGPIRVGVSTTSC